MGEWKPIETAPEGWGTVVDLWGGYGSCKKRRIVNCRRHNRDSDWHTECDEMGFPSLRNWTITHWMELPEPPNG